MNKQEVVDLLTTFLFESNLDRAINVLHLPEESIARISNPLMKKFFVGEAEKVYNFLDDNGLIVKP